VTRSPRSAPGGSSAVAARRPARHRRPPSTTAPATARCSSAATGDLVRAGHRRSAGRPPAFQSGWTGLDNSFGVTQFYAGAGHADTGKIIGGAQDHGTLCFDPQQGAQKWTTIFDGDGGWCAADPTDPGIFYGEYVFLGLRRNTDGGTTSDQRGDRYINGQFVNVAAGVWDWKPEPFRIPDAMPIPGTTRRNALFIAPFVLDPSQPERILAGGLSLWRTNDARTPNTPTSGPSWQSIKNPIVTSGDTRNTEISAIAVAPGDPDTIWVGHANGALFLTGNGTADTPTWQPVVSASLPPRRYCTHHHRPGREGRRLRSLRRICAATSGSPGTAAGRGTICPLPCPPRRCGR
jgi:hypothetical protein